MRRLPYLQFTFLGIFAQSKFALNRNSSDGEEKIANQNPGKDNLTQPSLLPLLSVCV
jgi:hypothetical protein